MHILFIKTKFFTYSSLIKVKVIVGQADEANYNRWILFYKIGIWTFREIRPIYNECTSSYFNLHNEFVIFSHFVPFS